MNVSLNRNKYLSLFILLIVFLSRIILYIINGENSFITIHDNLDSVFTWHKVISDNKINYSVFENPPVHQIMDGNVNRNHLTSPFNITSLILYYFPNYFGYITNMILAYLLGFIGMYVLLNIHIFNQGLFKFNYFDKIAILISATFIFFDIYTIYGGGYILGIPLLFYAFINLYKSINIYLSYFIIFICGLYTSFVLTAFFIIIILAIISGADIIVNKKYNTKFILGVLLFIITSVISEINIFLSFFEQDFISHRIEFSHDSEKLLFSEVVLLFFKTLIWGHYHAPTFSGIILLFLMFNIHKIFYKKEIIYLLLFIFFSITFFSLWHWKSFTDLKEKMTVLNIFNFSRVIFLNPVIWLLLLAFVLSQIKFKIKLLFYLMLFIQLFTVLYNNSELKNNLHVFLINNSNRKYLTYKEYYSQNLFNKIKKHINKDINSYKVVSLGLHPNIMLFNGFNTIDSYQVNYPLAYKHKFRKIITEELNKNDDLKKYFDGWGNRCYLFSAELGKEFLIYDHNRKINQLAINIEELKKMNCKYLISAVQIDNINSNDANDYLLNKYNDPDSKFEVYIYSF